jgi:hypothetical protein
MAAFIWVILDINDMLFRPEQPEDQPSVWVLIQIGIAQSDGD